MNGAKIGTVIIRPRRRQTRPDRNPGSVAIACFAGVAAGSAPGTAGCRTGAASTLAAGASTTASVSFYPFSFSAGHPILPTKLKRQAEASRQAEQQWSKVAKPRPADCRVSIGRMRQIGSRSGCYLI